MTQLTNPATHNHPNFVRAQAASDASRLGDYGPTFDMLAEEIILENGPGAGPWHIARGKEDMALGLIEFSAALGNTFRQDGRCVYADDRVIINLIHETGTAPGGDEFDNLAVYVAACGLTARLTGCGRSISTLSTARSSGDAITGSHPKTSGERRVARRGPERPSR